MHPNPKQNHPIVARGVITPRGQSIAIPARSAAHKRLSIHTVCPLRAVPRTGHPCSVVLASARSSRRSSLWNFYLWSFGTLELLTAHPHAHLPPANRRPGFNKNARNSLSFHNPISLLPPPTRAPGWAFVNPRRAPPCAPTRTNGPRTQLRTTDYGLMTNDQ